MSTSKDWPIGEMEPAICGLRSTIGIMDHMTTSDHEVTRAEWSAVSDILSDYAKRIDDLWTKVFEQHVLLCEEHLKALAAAKAEKAAPGSPADIAAAKAAWRFLRLVTENALQFARENDEQHAATEAVAEMKKW